MGSEEVDKAEWGKFEKSLVSFEELSNASTIGDLAPMFQNLMIGNNKLIKQQLSSKELSIIGNVIYPEDTGGKRRYSRSRLTGLLKEYTDIEVFTSLRDPEASRLLMMYDGQRFRSCQTDVLEAVAFLTGGSATPVEGKNVCHNLLSSRNLHTYIEELPDHSTISNLLNGVVDITDGEIITRPHQRNDYFKSIIPNSYVSDQRSSIFDEFLDYALDEKYHRFIYEWIGYLCFESYHLQYFVFHVGKGGTGKGTYDGVVSRVIGAENQSNIPLDQMLSNTFELRYLNGKLRNMGSEVSYQDMKRGATLINRLSSNSDTVHGDVKFKDAMEFRNTARLEFAMNDAAKRYKEQTGFDRRLIQVDWLQPMPMDVYRYFADPVTGMYTAESIEGVISTAIEYYTEMMFNRDGKFDFNPTSEERSRRYDLSSDPYGVFINEWLIITGSAMDYVSVPVLFHEYTEFCAVHDLQPDTESKFGHSRNAPSALRHAGATAGRETIDGIQTRVWQGIVLDNERSN